MLELYKVILIKKVITREEVEHIAGLCRIKLEEDEKSTFVDQFNDILDFFHKLDELDTANVNPTFHVIDIKNVFRSDIVRECLPKELIFKNISKKEKDYIIAPKMIE